MTRKYVRDNRGRFATTGATKRGAGLLTAAGNKRASVRMDGPAAKRAGAISGKVRRDPGAAGKIGQQKPRSAATSKLRPGELINANARPRNVAAKFQKGENPFHPFSVLDDRNVQTAKKIAESKGTKVSPLNWGEDKAIARGRLGKNEIFLNPNSSHWENPAKRQIAQRRSGHLSTSSPLGVIYHEIGHNRHGQGAADAYKKAGSKAEGPWSARAWTEAVRPSAKYRKISMGSKLRSVAGRVSQYAQKNPVEFVAEVYAGLKTGRKYDYEVMQAYREARGLPSKPPARRRSRLRKPK
jgi:hypothetical protein